MLSVSSFFTKYTNVKFIGLSMIDHDYQKRVLIFMTELGSSVVTICDWLTQEPPPLPENVERIPSDLDHFLGEFVTPPASQV